jgi:hypothetical protein
MLELCPTCGKTIGTLMESDSDRPGVIEILSGEANQRARIALTVALCVLLVPACVATEVVLR